MIFQKFENCQMTLPVLPPICFTAISRFHFEEIFEFLSLNLELLLDMKSDLVET